MNSKEIIKELQFKAIRSSGAGGQHVNKVSSKVVLSFNVFTSGFLSEEEKTLLTINLKNRLTKDGLLILSSDESRSQHRNKELVIKRFYKILSVGLTHKKKRKATKPSKASIKRRIENKQKTSLKKVLRKRKRKERLTQKKIWINALKKKKSQKKTLNYLNVLLKSSSTNLRAFAPALKSKPFAFRDSSYLWKVIPAILLR